MRISSIRALRTSSFVTVYPAEVYLSYSLLRVSILITLFFVRLTVAAGLEIVAAESENANKSNNEIIDNNFFIISKNSFQR